MRVGMLTVHQSENAGASLQAAALYRAIEDLGHEPTIINYCPGYLTGFMDRSNADKRRNARGIAKMLTVGSRLKKKMALFEAFGADFYPCMTKRADTFESLQEVIGKFDAYVCGSDQVWNPVHVEHDPAWFFPLAEIGARKVAFAASIGRDDLSDEDLHWLGDGARTFDAVGVREDTAVATLARLGVKATQCVDPTLLVSEDEWRRVANPPKGPIPDQFIFYYPLEANPLERSLVEKLKKTTGLPVVAATSVLKKPPMVDVQISVFGPREFLWLIDHACYCVTNSYHGSLFSMRLGTALIPFANMTKNSRMESLFRLMELPDDFQYQAAEELDESSIERRVSRAQEGVRRLEEPAEKSLAFLRESLS